MGVLSVFIAALGCFAAGAAWYMTLSKAWIAVVGIPVNAEGKPQGAGSATPFIIGFVAALLLSGMMRHVFATAGIDTAAKGLVSGLGVGVFILGPWLCMNYAYAQRPRMLMLIDGGYAVLGPAVAGLILGIVA
ncbi:DUF1761 domain-containing protein [Thalassococcus profundi]|uniref:DUF1761 domain-containing protein n=1 Tax=Thalassococcus profundi TaxID=2282382 RepID=A0A369TJ62_9RHOB|nr:DUF1761 domain-containing protein [Thalassococcus profundi]RDD64664.1 DUF1761 domain-containing protein [Thalassococcus profundi]